MKSPAERGAIGAWAYEARADADLSVEEVVERLVRGGQPVAAATIRGIEGGSKQPSRRLLRALAGVYGRPVPGDNEAGTGGDTLSVPAAYLEGINALTRQMASLTAQMAADRTLIRDLMEALAERFDPDLAASFRADVAAAEQAARRLPPPLSPGPFEGGGEPQTARPKTPSIAPDPL